MLTEANTSYPFNPWTDIPNHPPVTPQERQEAQHIARIQLLQEAETVVTATENERRRLHGRLFVRPRTMRKAERSAQKASDNYAALSSIVGWSFDFADGSYMISGKQLSQNPHISEQPILLEHQVFLDGDIFSASSPEGTLPPTYARNVHKRYAPQIAAGRKVQERSLALGGRLAPHATTRRVMRAFA